MSLFEFNNKEEKVHKIEADNCSTIYFGSPFFGSPQGKKIDAYFLMDTNIFNNICKNDYSETFNKFIEFAKHNRFELNPAFAISELYRTAENPRGYVDYYKKHLCERFGIIISDDSIAKCCTLAEELVPVMKGNIELIEEYLAIVKEIYNNSLSEEQSVRKFLNIIKDKNLPQFAFMIFSGLIFIFVKHNVSNCESIRRKVDSFLSIGKDYVEEKRKLHNGATDISIFLNVQEIAANSENFECTVANIVTRDEVVAYLLENLCIYSVKKIESGKHSGMITPRNSTVWMYKFEQYKDDIKDKLNRQSSGSEKEIDIRKRNLKNQWFLSLQRYLSF
ncbi:hypothetical protein Rhein_3231 [Rheinheimera sp. A13L]|uniref:hypothetical protein n=1 Tax=Rheinheimera sp. A13L TaxID=506534 RepID=UPI00021256F6|nr:hypothetical protein [Rheinheimera sp. A13L]EGM76682.1 hypothetical protein Rhein_3231 [Rheinheimera sp. A13L]